MLGQLATMPDQDQLMRMDCLREANRRSDLSEDPVKLAQEFYDFVTGKNTTIEPVRRAA